MDKQELRKRKEKALNRLNDYIESLIDSDLEFVNKKASILSYWLIDYVRFLKKEPTFDPKKNIKYNRGDIVNIHLGYNVGSELGGLHYAVVIDNNNSPSNPVVTIIPLGSMESGRKIHHSSVELGNEIFKSVISKHDKLENEVLLERQRLIDEVESIDESKMDALEQEQVTRLIDRLKTIDVMITNLGSLKKEILKMKEGSVALVSQVTTISKIRIYDPVYREHVLYGIKLHPTTLGKINEKLKELYIYMK